MGGKAASLGLFFSALFAVKPKMILADERPILVWTNSAQVDDLPTVGSRAPDFSYEEERKILLLAPW